MSSQTVTIAGRFRGPPDSGNGGYVCGLLAGLLGENPAEPTALEAEVTLRSPVPLEAPLTVEVHGAGLSAHHQGNLVAEAAWAPLQVDAPGAPAYELAEQVRSGSPAVLPSERFPGHTGVHPFCFCCGVENPHGLQVHAAPLPGHDAVAAAWPTRSEWADASGALPAALVWTALDCPGQFAFHAAGIRTGMLGRLCARIRQPVMAGERCVVVGWRIGIEGRKHYAGTALYDSSGRLCAYAKAVWVGRRE